MGCQYLLLLLLPLMICDNVSPSGAAEGVAGNSPLCLMQLSSGRKGDRRRGPLGNKVMKSRCAEVFQSVSLSGFRIGL